MKVFVTGSTGFIGSYVVPALVESGHEPVCLIWNKEPAVPDWMAGLGVRRVFGDITDRRSLVDGMHSCEALIHLAGLYTMWEPDRQVYTRVNVTGTRVTMEAALEVGVKKAINVSTIAIWGGTTDNPFTELSRPGEAPTSEYARTKYLGELEAWKLHREKGLPLVTINPCLVLGAGDTRPTGSYFANLLSRRLPAVMYTDSVLTFVHVRDVAAAIVRALELPGNIGQQYIIGKERLTVGEMSLQVAECGQVPPPRLELPGPLALAAAGLLTAFSNLIKRPPLWDLSLDQTRTLQVGLAADGSKAERELGIRYTPICQAIQESVLWQKAR